MDILESNAPIIIGALIAIVPNLINKFYDSKNQKKISVHKEKQEMYMELISLFNIVLKNQTDSDDLKKLQDRINLISITGSVDVVKALNEYIDTWSKVNKDEQNKKYTNLLRVIRVDLEIDKSINKEFPEIGLRELQIRK